MDPIRNCIMFVRLVSLRQYGLTFAKPSGGLEKARQRVIRTTILCFEYIPFNKALGRVESSIDPDRLQIAEGTTGKRRKKRPRLARQRSGRGSEGTAITRWPHDSEPEAWLDK